MSLLRVAVVLGAEGSRGIALADEGAPQGRIIASAELRAVLAGFDPILVCFEHESEAAAIAPPHRPALVDPASLATDAAALARDMPGLSAEEASALCVAAAVFGLLRAGDDAPPDMNQTPVDFTGLDPLRLRQALPRRAAPPRLKDDCFAMPQGVDWVPVDEALTRLRSAIHPVVSTQTVPSERAAGRILAEEAVARRLNPPAPNSAVDGYGFAATALQGDGPYRLPLLDGRAAAGLPFEGTVAEGAAVRILTGAMLPGGVDTVVLEEDTAIDGAAVVFDGPVRPFANTRKAGEDVEAGAPALPKGRVLRAPDVALLCALGVPEVETYRPLKVGVLSTGDEIIRGPDRPAALHQIWDANGPMLLSMIRDFGHEPVDLGHRNDESDAIAAAFDEASRTVDVVLTSGGASAGDEDHVSRLLRDQGQLSSWRIALKPGRPLALALWNGIPVFGLPGNPVAAFVCALIFARPALSLLAGAGWQEPQGFQVPAAFSKRKKPGRREYLRARLTDTGAAEVFASEGSGRISGLAWASGLVELPDEAADITPGDPVRFLPYTGFGLS